MHLNPRTTTMPPVRLLAASLVFTTTLATHGQQLTAGQIMARVAANQDSSEAARAHFVYVQHARVLSRRGSTIRCEEITDTRITPTPTGSHQQLLTLQGHVLHKGATINYDHLNPNIPGNHHIIIETDTPSNAKQTDDEETDVDLVEDIRSDLLGDKAGHNRDGINANLFPLTSKRQADYIFTLVGREPRNGRDTFHIRFKPRDKSDFDWKGDAWIDTATFEPVVIRTALSRSVPLGVRVLLGTNVPGIGFTVIYAPQSANQPGSQPGRDSTLVWFPISFGSEFKIHVLFFLSREMVISAENRDFERTHVTSTILNAASPTLAPATR